jgi:hypothetical protein
VEDWEVNHNSATSQTPCVATYNQCMEKIFGVISLCLFLLAIGTMVMIVREARGHLDQEDRDSLRKWLQTGSSTAVSQTLRNAWNQHALAFPASRKRTLFAVFVIGAALSVMFYPLWLAIVQR